MPEGVKVIEESNVLTTTFHSFTLLTRNSKRKHCTSLTFFENFYTKNFKFSISKTFCIVSNKPLYNTQKDILNSIFLILTNYKLNKSLFPEQLRYVYLKDKVKSYTVLKEYHILEFYFAFILNSIKSSNLEASYNLIAVGNNAGRKSFLKYHTNSSYGFPIVDSDMTILLNKFNVDDLIKIYLGMLMEYKIIIMFEDYSEISELIFALTSLLYPLKWHLPLISFITPTLIETLEAPFAIIMGVHTQYRHIVTDF